MKVILLNDVAKLGRKYEIKEVRSGYAQNYLIPKRQAELATGARLQQLEKLQKKAEEERKVQEELLAKDFEAIENTRVTISRKVNEQGHLFEGVHVHEIVVALAEQAKINLSESMIKLGGTIKSAGEHKVDVEVLDKKGALKVIIEAES